MAAPSFSQVLEAPAAYALDFRVHKTFVDCRLDRPESLDGFFREREVHSCPVSMISDPEVVEECNVKGPGSDFSTAASSVCGSPGRSPPRSPEVFARQVLPASFVRQLPFFGGSCAAGAPMSAPPAAPPVLSLSVAPLVSAPVGAPKVPDAMLLALPSLGSAEHSDGSCKPCAFFHAKGCVSGASCQFCHLCGPGEKKRRQREKKAFFGALRKLQQLMGGEASA